MCLIGMDVNHPEDDFVGFSIEVKVPAAEPFPHFETASPSPTTNQPAPL
jgi:hypothetical protein